MIEKKIHSVDFTNPYENSIERNPEILETVESNCKIIRRVYQHIYTDIADIFFEYIHSLDLDEIQGLDKEIKSNGWGVKNLLDIGKAMELLSVFQTFHQNTARLPLTNGLLIVPEGDVPDGEEKINMKNLYEMF